MTVLSLAGCQYYVAALGGTSRRPLALGCSASRTPTQSTAVLHRRGRISSGSPENRGALLSANLDELDRPRAIGPSSVGRQLETTSEVHCRGCVGPAFTLPGRDLLWIDCQL